MRAAYILAFGLVFALAACTGEPVVGTLPEGIYGSPDLGLSIDATGDAVFVRSCGAGDLGVVTVTDGTLNADFLWVVTGGAAIPDTADYEGTPATVNAQVTTTRVWGTIDSGGEIQDIDLDWGEQPTYFECP